MYRQFSHISSVIRFIFLNLIFISTLAGMVRADGTYEGSLMIIIAEPVSRWEDYSVVPYNFAYLHMALDTAIALDSMQSAHITASWDASGTSYSDIQRDNIISFAVIHNASPYVGYSAPPNGNPFTAYWVDAAAAATPDSQWGNTGNPDFTHTVFGEEGTSTYCPDCPVMRAFLHEVFETHDYPFFYTALVADKNAEAYQRLWNYYNVSWIPICYYDGGYIVNWGGIGEDDAIYRHCIETAGCRPVMTLGLTAQMNWLGGGQVEIIVDIVNSGYQNIAPGKPSSPSGINKGYYLNQFEFSSRGTDQDSEQLYYRFQWSPSEVSDWMGPYQSGDSCYAAHTWAALGSFYIKVQTLDEWNFTSYWSDSILVTTYNYFAGDPNGDHYVNILDCTYLIRYLYKSGPPPNPLAAGDANGNGSINILDVTYLINFLYKGGPAPVYPS
ncbi:MAG: dockerin type I domain-containing protein [Candidatus Zixiibacteriota bacterium]